MWLSRRVDAYMNTYSRHIAGLLVGFLVASVLAIFGVEIVYAIIIGIASGIIVFFLAFR